MYKNNIKNVLPDYMRQRLGILDKNIATEQIHFPQNMDMLDKQIRPLIEYEYKHRKMVNAGLFGYVISFFAGSRFLYRKEWAQVRKMGKGVSVGWQFGQYGKKVYKAYDTFKTW